MPMQLQIESKNMVDDAVFTQAKQTLAQKFKITDFDVELNNLIYYCRPTRPYTCPHGNAHESNRFTIELQNGSI